MKIIIYPDRDDETKKDMMEGKIGLVTTDEGIQVITDGDGKRNLVTTEDFVSIVSGAIYGAYRAYRALIDSAKDKSIVEDWTFTKFTIECFKEAYIFNRIAELGENANTNLKDMSIDAIELFNQTIFNDDFDENKDDDSTK